MTQFRPDLYLVGYTENDDSTTVDCSNRQFHYGYLEERLHVLITMLSKED